MILTRRPAWVIPGLAVLAVVLAFVVYGMKRPAPSYSPREVVRANPLQAAHSLPEGAHAPRDWGGSGPAPRMEISPAFHDFGTIDAVGKQQFTFAVANRGAATLLIQRAYTTCECTDAVFSSSAVPPGKVALVTVTFDPALHGYPGATIRRGVLFETNDPAQSEGELWIQARLR